MRPAVKAKQSENILKSVKCEAANSKRWESDYWFGSRPCQHLIQIDFSRVIAARSGCLEVFLRVQQEQNPSRAPDLVRWLSSLLSLRALPVSKSEVTVHRSFFIVWEKKFIFESDAAVIESHEELGSNLNELEKFSRGILGVGLNCFCTTVRIKNKYVNYNLS